MIGGEVLAHDSLEEAIARPLLPLVKADDYAFHAAGREDVDVRMLGDGRPFILELMSECVPPMVGREYEPQALTWYCFLRLQSCFSFRGKVKGKDAAVLCCGLWVVIRQLPFPGHRAVD